jgi:uncharacterized protein YjbJ (UPF0337 family)
MLLQHNMPNLLMYKRDGQRGKSNIMKNIIELKGSWNETKGKLKQRFAKLTNNDLLLVEGRQEEMLGRLQAKLGKTREELKKLISEL